MSSATHAISQNRDIMVFDDEALKYNSGGRKLIEDGAKRITKNDLTNNSQMIHISDILPDSPQGLSNSLAMLSKMELEGKVREVGGGYFEFFK
jgi:predicted Rossmann fold nucleotide-binding protein DprA/Smf involved in DNA uptake